MTKLSANSYDNLTPNQKAFIRAKVIDLGSMEAVEEFYSKRWTTKKDLVERYSRKIARECFK